jgi:hypothetical protein
MSPMDHCIILTIAIHVCWDNENDLFSTEHCLLSYTVLRVWKYEVGSTTHIPCLNQFLLPVIHADFTVMHYVVFFRLSIVVNTMTTSVQNMMSYITLFSEFAIRNDKSAQLQ